MPAPAARLTDMTAHGGPLAPGPGSETVFIGGLPAWRALPIGGAAALTAIFTAGMEDIAASTAAVTATAGTPAAPAAVAKQAQSIANAVTAMTDFMTGSGADLNACPIVKVVIPDGTGVVLVGSETVLINGLPACRIGDPIQEATSVNTIASGCPTVIIGP